MTEDLEGVDNKYLVIKGQCDILMGKGPSYLKSTSKPLALFACSVKDLFSAGKHLASLHYSSNYSFKTKAFNYKIHIILSV